MICWPPCGRVLVSVLRPLFRSRKSIPIIQLVTFEVADRYAVPAVERHEIVVGNPSLRMASALFFEPEVEALSFIHADQSQKSISYLYWIW